jgi:poly(ADP-ribose) glycohydrolase ARH3
MTELYDRYKGIGAGLVIGDAHCAPYEGGPLERGLWRLIGRTGGKHRFTDDTQMAFDLGNHLARNGRIEQQQLAVEFAKSYQWSRGYGPSTLAVLRQIRKGKHWLEAATHRFKDGSFGNGAAMRIAPLVVYLHHGSRLDQVNQWVTESAEVTHPNQKAIDGALAVALCLAGALDGLDPIANIRGISAQMESQEFKANLDQVYSWLESGAGPSPEQAKRMIGAGTAATQSCPIAIYIGLRGAQSPLSFIIESSNVGGGDTDTIGAMAGAIWGAYNGFKAIPADYIETTEGIDEMIELVDKIVKSELIQ